VVISLTEEIKKKKKRNKFLIPDYIPVAPYAAVLTSHNMKIK
jgi:hypothetical protein